jgi:hypothetical protein
MLQVKGKDTKGQTITNFRADINNSDYPLSLK